MHRFDGFRVMWKCPALLLALITALPVSLFAQPRLTIRIDSSSLCPSSSGYASVYITNPFDSIAGFSLWVQLNNPDLISIGPSIDTAGTLLSGFELVDAHTLGMPGTDLKVVALADMPGGGVKSPIPPSAAVRLLCRIPYTTHAVSDTATIRTTLLHLNTVVSQFSFSDQNGQPIGLRTVVDTTQLCYRCNFWSGSVCLGGWSLAPTPPCDSIAFSVDTLFQLDTALVKITDGVVDVAYPIANVTDCDNDGIALTVADYVALIRYINDESFVLPDPRNADVNGDCVIDCHDAELFTQLFICPFGCHQFASCSCEHPVRGSCCCGMRGDVNLDLNHNVTITDLTFLVSYLFAGGITPLCAAEANVNGTSGVTVQDLITLAHFLFGGGPAPAACP